MRTSMAAMTGPLFRFSLLLTVAAIAFTAQIIFATAANDTCVVRQLPPDIGVAKYHFDIQTVDYSVNCHTKPILTVNGMFPGPIIYAKEGDRIIVNVTNSSPADMTIHFHGIRQVKSPWMDGVDAVSMCPIKSGDYFVHDFIIPNQQGTLLWHAHIGWQRATIHGAFITEPIKDWNRPARPGFAPATKWYPNLANRPYPFAKPAKEFPIVVELINLDWIGLSPGTCTAEWWYKDIEEIETTGIDTGGIFPTSDAVTINGHPGPFYNCSARSNTPLGSKIEEITSFEVNKGKTYLLRIVNAATNMHIFFSVGNHTLTVVEADGEYVQPFKTSIVFLSPGQTVNALITADQKSGIYTVEVGGYGREPITGQPAALFKYYGEPYSHDLTHVHRPTLPPSTDIDEVFNFTDSLKTLYPGHVPLTVDRNIFMPIGISRRPCDEPPNVVSNASCSSGLRAQAQVTNITFVAPSIAILQASFENIPGVFTEDFPDQPAFRWNYTGPSPPAPYTVSEPGTKVIPITFNETVEVVLQDTAILGAEDHPFHLHGHNFYVLARGLGNYAEPVELNLVDPVLRNTVAVPAGGWAVIRFKANNPGVWIFHCHLDKHTSWGMMAVFHIKNGDDADSQYNCPPERLMPCT